MPRKKAQPKPTPEPEPEIEIPFEEEPITAEEPSAGVLLHTLTGNDPGYIEFFMGPLRESWRNSGQERNPRTLDEAAESFSIVGEDGTRHNAGYTTFAAYYQSRHRQWLLERIPLALEAGASAQKDRARGQTNLF